MSDRALRQLQRQAATGDPGAAAKLARELNRVADNRRRFLMAPNIKRAGRVMHVVAAWKQRLDAAMQSIDANRRWAGPTENESLCGQRLSWATWQPAVADRFGDVAGFELGEGYRVCKSCMRSVRTRSIDGYLLPLWRWQVAWSHEIMRYPYPGEFEATLLFCEQELLELGRFAILWRPTPAHRPTLDPRGGKP